MADIPVPFLMGPAATLEVIPRGLGRPPGRKRLVASCGCAPSASRTPHQTYPSPGKNTKITDSIFCNLFLSLVAVRFNVIEIEEGFFGAKKEKS